MSLDSFGQELIAARDDLRILAESRMGAVNGGSDARVRRKTGTTRVDGIDVPTYADIHAGPMRLGGSRSGPSRSKTADYAQGVEVEYGVRVASFPISATGLADNDIVEITAGENVGTFWVLGETDGADQQTARRYLATATTPPKGW